MVFLYRYWLLNGQNKAEEQKPKGEINYEFNKW